MKKILLVLPHLSVPGGVANYYNLIIPYLKEQNSFELRTLEVGRVAHQDLVANFMRPLSDQYRFRRILDAGQFDIVQVNPSLNFKSFIRDGLFIAQAKKRGSKVIVFFRGWYNSFERKVDPYLLGFFKKTYGLADAFIVLSSHGKEKLKEWKIKKPIYEETTVVTDEFLKQCNLENKLDKLKNNEYPILFLSRLEKVKGAVALLSAMRILLKKRANIKLTMAGNGSLLVSLKRKTEKDKLLRNYVRFTGFIQSHDKLDILSSHTLFCLPTYSEGLPNALLEAMAVGLIPVVTFVGGIKDFFKDRQMGIVVKQLSPQGIADAIEEAIALSSEEKMRIIQSNFELIKTRCIASCVSNRLLKIYSSL